MAFQIIADSLTSAHIQSVDVDIQSAADSNTPSTSSGKAQLVDVAVQVSTDAKLFHLQRKVKTLKQKVRRRDLKIFSMKEVIEKISKSGFSNENLHAVLKHYFEGRCVVISEHTVNKINIPGLPLELVLLQKENATKSAVQRRYSPTMKQFAHTLYFYSPKAYKFLRQYFIKRPHITEMAM